MIYIIHEYALTGKLYEYHIEDRCRLELRLQDFVVYRSGGR